MHRITRKRPPRPGEPGYGNVKRRIAKKRPPRNGEPGYRPRDGERNMYRQPILHGNGKEKRKGKGKKRKGNALSFAHESGRPPGNPGEPPTSGKGNGKQYKGKGISFEYEAGKPPGNPGEAEVPVAPAPRERATTDWTSTWP